MISVQLKLYFVKYDNNLKKEDKTRCALRFSLHYLVIDRLLQYIYTSLSHICPSLAMYGRGVQLQVSRAGVLPVLDITLGQHT